MDGALTLEDGTVNVVTSGGKYVYNAALDLDSSPKGVKADGEITINGGMLNIQVTGRSDGYEGLESKTKITVNGDEIFVYAYDDAINVSGDNPVGMEINGGLVIASGSAVPEEGLDCDFSQNFIVTGGTLVGTGGAAVSTSTSSTQRSVIYNGVSAKTGGLFVVTDSDGKPILKYEMPRTMNSMAVFFSSPDIRSGGTYAVYSGGTLSGNTVNWNGWFDEDGTYTAGTKLGTFTSSSINTTVGQSSGPLPSGRDRFFPDMVRIGKIYLYLHHQNSRTSRQYNPSNISDGCQRPLRGHCIPSSLTDQLRQFLDIPAAVIVLHLIIYVMMERKYQLVAWTENIADSEKARLYMIPSLESQVQESLIDDLISVHQEEYKVEGPVSSDVARKAILACERMSRFKILSGHMGFGIRYLFFAARYCIWEEGSNQTCHDTGYCSCSYFSEELRCEFVRLCEEGMRLARKYRREDILQEYTPRRMLKFYFGHARE